MIYSALVMLSLDFSWAWCPFCMNNICMVGVFNSSTQTNRMRNRPLVVYVSEFIVRMAHEKYKKKKKHFFESNGIENENIALFSTTIVLLPGEISVFIHSLVWCVFNRRMFRSCFSTFVVWLVVRIAPRLFASFHSTHFQFDDFEDLIWLVCGAYVRIVCSHQ